MAGRGWVPPTALQSPSERCGRSVPLPRQLCRASWWGLKCAVRVTDSPVATSADWLCPPLGPLVAGWAVARPAQPLPHKGAPELLPLQLRFRDKLGAQGTGDAQSAPPARLVSRALGAVAGPAGPEPTLPPSCSPQKRPGSWPVFIWPPGVVRAVKTQPRGRWADGTLHDTDATGNFVKEGVFTAGVGGCPTCHVVHRPPEQGRPGGEAKAASGPPCLLRCSPLPCPPLPTTPQSVPHVSPGTVGVPRVVTAACLCRWAVADCFQNCGFDGKAEQLARNPPTPQLPSGGRQDADPLRQEHMACRKRKHLQARGGGRGQVWLWGLGARMAGRLLEGRSPAQDGRGESRTSHRGGPSCLSRKRVTEQWTRESTPSRMRSPPQSTPHSRPSATLRDLRASSPPGKTTLGSRVRKINEGFSQLSLWLP